MKLSSQKGVTLTSLTIYIIVSTILLGTLAFVNNNFMSELGELTKQAETTNEMMKFYAFFVNDVKAANQVLEYSDSYVRFDNDVQYHVKYRANQRSQGSQTYDVYEIYKDNVMITDKLSGAFFEYNPEYRYIKVKLAILSDNKLKTEEQCFRVGRGY